MGIMSFLFGSTAEVVLDEDRATKHYYGSCKQNARSIEKENLEILWEHLGYGDVRVPALLTVEYGDGDSILALTTEQVYGLTLNQLREDGFSKLANKALDMAKTAIEGSGVHLPDLATDGNILVQVQNNKVYLVYIVDVGDIY